MFSSLRPESLGFVGSTLVLLLGGTAGAVGGCSSDDSDGGVRSGTGGVFSPGPLPSSDYGLEGGTGGRASPPGGAAGTSGTAGSSAGSAGASAGSAGASAGSAGSAGRAGSAGSAGSAGNAGAAGRGGSAGATTGSSGGSVVSDFWKEAYNASGAPVPASGRHRSGDACMESGCHSGTGSRDFLFGGTVFLADGTTGAPFVQVGVSVGGQSYFAYSATNGNFWVDAPTTTVDMTKAEARMRTASGEATKHGTAVGADCNSCHSGQDALIKP